MTRVLTDIQGVISNYEIANRINSIMGRINRQKTTSVSRITLLVTQMYTKQVDIYHLDNVTVTNNNDSRT